MSDRFSRAFEDMKEKAEEIKENSSEDVKGKMDDKLGVYIHKYVATMFYWDSDLQEMMREVERLTEEGKKQEALIKSQEMKTYINLKTSDDSGYQSRRYQKKISQISEKMEEQSDKIEKAYERLDDSRFITWLEDTMGKESSEVTIPDESGS
mgnify:CR=1 FL=1